MYYVYDEKANKVELKDALRGNKYYCPICHQEVFIGGKKEENYIYHYKDYPCLIKPIFKNSYDKEFFKHYKNMFPKNNRDIIYRSIDDKTKVVVSDITINNKILKILTFSYKKRNFDNEKELFFNKDIKEVIYLINIEEHIKKGLIQYASQTNKNRLYFTHCDEDFKKLLDMIDEANPKYSLYFSVSSPLKNYQNDFNDDGYIKLERDLLLKAETIKRYNKNNYLVTTSKIVEIEDFLSIFNVKYNPPFLSKRNLYDELSLIKIENDVNYYYGCPISSSHTCSSKECNDPSIQNMNECDGGCSAFKPFCNKRLKELKIDDSINILKVCRTLTGLITYIEGIDSKNKIVKFFPKKLEEIGGEEIKGKFKVFYNTKQGYYIKLIDETSCLISKNKNNFKEDNSYKIEKLDKAKIWKEIKS